MSFFMIFRVALKALGRNKMRTLLTMLGMIIGVAAVITMVALGNGAQQQIEEQVQSGGTNLIMIRAGNYRRGGVSSGMGTSPRLKAKDVAALREQVPGAQYLTASVGTRDQVICLCSIDGCIGCRVDDGVWLDVRQMLAQGGFITDIQLRMCYRNDLITFGRQVLLQGLPQLAAGAS